MRLELSPSHGGHEAGVYCGFYGGLRLRFTRRCVTAAYSAVYESQCLSSLEQDPCFENPGKKYGSRNVRTNAAPRTVGRRSKTRKEYGSRSTKAAKNIWGLQVTGNPAPSDSTEDAIDWQAAKKSRSTRQPLA